jgi:hypothetical protein
VKKKMQRMRNNKANSKSSRFPILVAAKAAGATLLRTIWQGHGDDGCFEHQLFKNRQRMNFKGNVETDVETIIEENGFIIDGMMNGSVGILEITYAPK